MVTPTHAQVQISQDITTQSDLYCPVHKDDKAQSFSLGVGLVGLYVCGCGCVQNLYLCMFASRYLCVSTFFSFLVHDWDECLLMSLHVNVCTCTHQYTSMRAYICGNAYYI